MNLEKDILEIKQRNLRVEADKRWEGSWQRKAVISVLTYMFAAAWLMVIREPSLWWKAMVPVAGYLLSTLTLSSIKKRWQGNN